jgi:hypothetical protein
MLNPNALEEKILPLTSYQVAGSVIRTKVVITGFNGCGRPLA